MDIDAEREKITQEIKELERILDPSSSSIHVEVSESSLDSDSEAGLLPGEGLDAADPPILEEEKWGEASNDEDDAKDRTLPEDPETCLQLNMVYQEVIREKLAEVSLLLAQNREQQEEIMWDLAGPKGPKVKDSKSLPLNVYIGHFMKPYFKDRVTGVGPPANEETREKAAQGIKAFEELLVTKWKHWEKALLRKSVVSDRLQRLLQPKLLKLEYLQQKQSRVPSEPEKQALDKQIREAEKEIQDINQLPEEALLGNRLDNHDWEKISKVNFEGGRGAEEIRKFWQNSEHPSINKQEWSGEEVERLKAIAASHGHLEWQKVAEELGTCRSAFQCLQTFQRHNTALRRREWTQEEDHMLTQLVQEMRVGSHIPYRRIVYYMEGRDSVQLTYRWTKSLDPNLKKGFWAPEEDAKLLQAVAKYGEQDWFKIREEVPGRSDAQCRDRYLRRLHFSLKKGRWNLKEEEQLLELIEKYGVGHWAKIASELPHRSGSQCLSKWKVMIGKRQGLQRRRRRLRRGVRWSSSSSSSGGDTSSSGGSSSSSSSSEESEAELEQVQEGGKVPLSPQYVVPDMDLWVPARQSTSQPRRGGAGGRPGRPAASLGPPRGSRAAQGGREEAATTPAPREELSPAQGPPGTHSTAPPRVQDSHSADTRLASSEELALEDGSRLLKVPLETVLRVLRTNTAARSRSLKEKLKQPPLPSTPLGASSGDSVAQSHVRQLWHRTFQNGRRRWRHALHQRLLDRRLLLAVTPWVGDVIVPCMPVPRRPVAQTRADSLGKQLQHARLASTPVFMLFIQLFQIDTAGCMEVVRERKVQTPRLLQAGTQDPCPRPVQEPPRAPSTPGCLFPNVTAQKAAHNASCQAECAPAPVPPPAPCGPRPKPKTVSELLREKRQREARARKAAQGPVVLAPRLLLSSPVVLQPTLPPAPHGPPAPGPAVSITAASPGTSASWQEAGTSAKDKGPSTLQTLPLAAASGTPPSQVPGSCHPNSLGQSQVPATSRKQGLPEALPFLPAAPSPAQPPTQPLSLTHRGGPHVAANIPLPVTWVLTAQGLLPVSVPAVVGLPRPAGTPDPTGLPVTLLPPPAQTRAAQGPQAPGLSCPWQPQASVDVGADPSPKTSPSTPPTPLPSQGPAEVDGGVACVASTPPQPDHLEAEPLWPSRLPACSGAGLGSDPGGTPGPPSGTREPRGPPPAHEKGSLDLGLLSQESEAATLEWLRGQGGGGVPPLGSRLPYQPPALCSLRALSGLLLHKKALEHKATSLVASTAAGGQAEPRAGALQAALGLVQGQLRDNPAYLLLKARFLAAFTVPALLATLPPSGVPTTLSAATGVGSESEDEGLDEPELTAASSLDQRTPGPGEGSAPSRLEAAADLDTLDTDLDVLRTRHSRHARKRRRLL